MNKKSDKRRKLRKDCQVPIDCKKGNLFDSSQTIDFSAGGVGFLSEKPIPVNTKTAVELALTPNSDPVIAVGRVKWISQVAVGERYRVGMEFEEVMSTSPSRFEKIITQQF